MTPAAEILSRLIQFNTVSDRSNLALLDWVEDQLGAHGIAARRVPDETGEKANLIATVGPADIPGYILSGHTDVVPVAGQDWTRDPFGGEIEGGRVWGRGATDMKGYLACVLAAAPEMTAAPLARPLHIVFSYDEEVGCVGVRGALRDIAEWPVRPLGCFVGEPTSMDVVIGHKAKRSLRVHVRGKSAHSSLAPSAVNAAEYAARLAAFVSDRGRRFAAEGAQDPLYDVGHTTAHVGVLNGGVQLNIVPDTAHLDFEIRAIGLDDPEDAVAEIRAFAETELVPAMQAVDPEAGMVFETLSGIDGLEIDADHDVVRLAKRCAGRNDHGKVAYATEGGLFQRMASVPAVVVGPGDIDQAHKPDEFIDIAQLDACSGFLKRLIDTCRTSTPL